MAKAGTVVLADTATHGDLGRIANARVPLAFPDARAALRQLRKG